MELTSECPGDDLVAAYVDGRLSVAEAAAFETHLAACAGCRELVSVLSRAPGGESLLASSSPAPAPEGAAAAVDRPSAPPGGRGLAAGTRVGRFVVLRPIGSGGMGIVVVAYDPELERTVALKVMRPELWRGAGAEARSRLRREAQAMARLSHPNIVTIYDIGMRGDEVFIAMEYVDGGTLRERHEATDATWRDVLEDYVAAGRGLAAAHAVGMVHRDFKPENVMRRSDGRVLVTDFGLAHEAHTVLGGDEAAAAAALPRLRLTEAGVLLGTPAYMAPEQLAMRGEVGPRADQFSFCVAVFEALYGERPFAGETAAAYLDNVRAGAIRPPPRRSDVPRRLREVLARGLSADPDDRYASMNELLAELARARAPRWRRAAIAASAVVAVSAGLAGGALLTGAPEPCGGGAERAAAVWGDAQRRALVAAFAATKLPHGEETAERVAARLDDYTSAWQASYRDACEATHVRGEQSSELLDLRMSCLDRRLSEAGALAGVLAGDLDVEMVGRAVDAAADLTTLDSCDETRVLKSRAPLPSDPERRRTIAAHRSELDRLRARARAGDYEGGDERAAAILERAAAVGYAPLEAEAAIVLADYQAALGDAEAAESSLRRALEAAGEGGHLHAAARAWVELIRVAGVLLEKETIGSLAAAAAQTAVMAAGGDEALTAKRLRHEGLARAHAGNYDAAMDRYERALALWPKAEGPSGPGAARTRVDLATAIARNGDREAASRALEDAIGTLETALGSGHPTTAVAIGHLGITLFQTGHRDEGQRRIETSLKLLERALGDDHPDVLRTLQNLGTVAERRGDYDRAREIYERTAAAQARVLGADHPRTAIARMNLGAVHLARGSPGEARDVLITAVESLERSREGDHPDLVAALTFLGDAYRQLGDAQNAVRVLERALAMAERALGKDHIDTSRPVFYLAMVLTESSETERAQRLAQRAVDIRERSLGAGHPNTSNARVALADVLRKRGDRDAARRHLARALEAREEALGAEHPDLVEPLLELGEIALEAGDAAKARRLLERAMAITESAEVTPETVERAARALARARRRVELDPD